MTVHNLTLNLGASLCVHDEGDGPLMVLISGLGGTAQFWHKQRQHFSQSFRVISFDQPGCGAAPARLGPISIEFLAALTAEMLERIAPGQSPAVLIGHSTGGAIAQEWLGGQHGPQPSRLVLSGTWSRACTYMHSLFDFRMRSLGPHYHGDLGAYSDLTRLLACDPTDVVKPFPPSPTEVDPVKAATQISRMEALLKFNGENQAPNISVPTIVLGTTNDRIIPVYHQYKLAELIPNVSLNILPDGGHFFPQTRSTAFIDTLQTWL